METLYQITAPHFCAGLVVREIEGSGVVIAAAPIIYFTLHWSEERMLDYFYQKNFKVAFKLIG